MINIKKIGATALVGSLAAISANAGELAVTGNATVSYSHGGSITAQGTDSFTNDQASIGHNTALNFTGTGELDNGWTFVMAVAGQDQMKAGQTSSYTSMTMGSLGTLTTGTHTGGAASKYDEEVPQAYEQASDALSTGSASSNKVGDQLDSAAILYNSPEFDVAGATVSFDVDYAPQANDAQASDGGQVAASTSIGAGYGLGVTVKYDDMQFGAYGNEVENTTDKETATLASNERDATEYVAYAKYSMGPLALGVSRSYIDAGKNTAGTVSNIGQTLRTAGGYFENDQMSVAYNVNDALSVSYTRSVDTYVGAPVRTIDAAMSDFSVDTTTNAIQAAYSMGAMSLKAYNMQVKNPQYDSDKETLSVTEVALGLAF
jgi:outer membrane protein OmpU